MKAGKKENKLGMRASETAEVIFEECRMSAGERPRQRRARDSNRR
jgi:alkylation response protein AidB-like acyl-CoA dehydrogenase